ncbi:MAG: RNA polymerase sigma factor [Phycisphaerales bacterium]
MSVGSTRADAFAGEDPDRAAIARVLAGDIDAFEDVVRRHNQRAYRVARSIAHSDADAEDIVQTAYLRAFTGLAAFDGRSRFGSWLTRIVMNEAIDATRRTRRRRESPLEEGAVMEASGWEGDGMADGSNRETMRSGLARAIERLPESLRLVFVLREVQRLGVGETAVSLGLTESNVKVRLHRARAELRSLLAEELGAELEGVYRFDGARCDRVTAAVMRAIRHASRTQ